MKYQGSKARIVSSILPLMLDDDHTSFVDVFCGGCNVIAEVPPRYDRYANDANVYLMSMWEALMDNDVTLPRNISVEKWDWYRRVFKACEAGQIVVSDKERALIGWCGYMASRNGRFFEGGYSGKCGKRDYIAEAVRNIWRQCCKLRGVTFSMCDYRDMYIPDNSIIYCDPPYDGKKMKGYIRNIVRDEFWDWCREMSSMGHKVYVSEYSAPDDFACIWEKPVKCTIAPKKTYRRTERLFTLE